MDDQSEVVAYLNSLPPAESRKLRRGRSEFRPDVSCARCYLRVSTDEQENGLSAQRETLQRHYDAVLKPKGYKFGGWYPDEAISGRLRLMVRPEGHRLATDLERGDLAVFAKLDRGFRSLADLSVTIEHWTQLGIDFQILDVPFADTTNPIGMALLQMAGVFAELERKRIGERTREGMAVLKRAGRPVSRPPHGFRIKRFHDRNGEVSKRVFVRDDHERAIGGLIVDWRNKGYSWSQIYVHLFQQKIRTREGREWSEGTIKRAYWAELRIREYESRRNGS